MDSYIGEVILFAGDFAPQNWAFCQGQLMPISQNPALYSILGNTYGGNGETTFALPKLAPLDNVNYIICLQGVFPPRG